MNIQAIRISIILGLMRLKEIDFLRGLAVILVLFRHYNVNDILYKAGWIGVDLFFVLSGFLVSNLLFYEYKKYGNINASKFLIRRGFKIYPLFYLMLVITVLIEHYLYAGINKAAFLAELFFIQNYFPAIWNHTWSLAVEEHFYLGIALLTVLLVRKKLIDNIKFTITFFISIFVLCLSLRVFNHTSFPYVHKTHLFPTHFRIDSLLFGVALSYIYVFRKESFFSFFIQYRVPLYLLSILFILPSFIYKVDTFTTYTFGLTYLYLGFGIILSNFITDKNINQKLNQYLSKSVVNFTSKVGYYSYSIYLFHMLVVKYITDILELDYRIEFLLYFFGSIIFGIMVSKLVEQHILRLREKWFPKRSHQMSTKKIVLQNQ